MFSVNLTTTQESGHGYYPLVKIPCDYMYVDKIVFEALEHVSVRQLHCNFVNNVLIAKRSYTLFGMYLKGTRFIYCNSTNYINSGVIGETEAIDLNWKNYENL